MAAMAPVTTLKMRCVRSFWRRISRGTITSNGRAAASCAGRTRRATSADGRHALAVVDAQDDLVDAVRARRRAPRSRAGRGTNTRAVHVARADGAGARRARRARPSSTPTTSYQSPPSGTRCPAGASNGKSACATEAPSTATRLRSSTSRSARKRPGGQAQARRLAVGRRSSPPRRRRCARPPASADERAPRARARPRPGRAPPRAPPPRRAGAGRRGPAAPAGRAAPAARAR